LKGAQAKRESSQAKKGPDKAVDNVKGEGKIHKHHSDPKFMGGDPKQKLTDLPAEQHKSLHKKLNEHLENYTDEFGNSMRPKKGNSGEKIRKNFSREERKKAMQEFYNKNKKEFPEAAKDYAKNSQ
jgi:hypothetical protein